MGGVVGNEVGAGHPWLDPEFQGTFRLLFWLMASEGEFRVSEGSWRGLEGQARKNTGARY